MNFLEKITAATTKNIEVLSAIQKIHLNYCIKQRENLSTKYIEEISTHDTELIQNKVFISELSNLNVENKRVNKKLKLLLSKNTILIQKINNMTIDISKNNNKYQQEKNDIHNLLIFLENIFGMKCQPLERGVRIIFVYLDLKKLNREFKFDLYSRSNDYNFFVKNCDFYQNDGVHKKVDSFVSKLNKTRNISEFLQEMRKLFKTFSNKNQNF